MKREARKSHRKKQGGIDYSKKEIVINFEGSEIIEREASRFGTGAHVIIPKEYAGKKVKIIFERGEK